MQRKSVRHWSERVWKKPRNTPGSCACFFQAFAAQLIAEIHSSYLTDSGLYKPEKISSKNIPLFSRNRFAVRRIRGGGKAKPFRRHPEKKSCGVLLFCCNGIENQTDLPLSTTPKLITSHEITLTILRRCFGSSHVVFLPGGVHPVLGSFQS